MDSHYKIPKLYGIENMTTEEFMDRLDLFQGIFGKLDEFGWWDMEIIQTDTGMRLTPKEFQEGIYIRGFPVALAAPDHQEMNGRLK